MEREFLGWDRPLLAAASEWLVERFDTDFDGVLIALPGARSGRILNELLARSVGPRLRPPRIVTAGLASDELLELDGVPASRLVRTLAWSRALAGMGPRQITELVARPPDASDLGAWMALAEEVRGLFGEVAAEGLDFAGIAENPELCEVAGEQRRWAALAAAQAAMTRLLGEAGFVDPHLGRLQAIELGRTRSEETYRSVCLIGVTELNALLRRALESSPISTTALVFAPPEMTEMFDELGGLVPAAWSDRKIDLDSERQWFVVRDPVDQAQQVKRVIASWRGKYAAEQISIGLADQGLAPHLFSELASGGVVARNASGISLVKTAPMVLLAALARFLRSRSFEDYAALVRHPDFEAALGCTDEEFGARATEDFEAVGWLDAYHEGHMPQFADGGWSADVTDRRDRELAANMTRLWSATGALLGKLVDGSVEDAIAAFAETRTFLERVFGVRDLDPEVETDRISIAALSQIGSGLDELESLPACLSTAEKAPKTGVASHRVSEALELLVRTLAGGQISPAAAQPGEPTIEMLGWLELALDDAPALIVTGFEQGKIPESIRGDAYLPNLLRRSLGMADNQNRLARDLYATELLLRSREEVAFITGRRGSSGDPQVPSPILFHCADDEVVARTRRFLTGGDTSSSPSASDSSRTYELPRVKPGRVLESLSVTDFGSYLNSPYRFYLQRMLGLKTIDDRARELQPMTFGILAHAVVQRFGEDESVRDSLDQDVVAEFLSSELKRFGRECFGKTPLPAVRLQLEQLDYRLRRFAAAQARRARDGWRIHAVEWKPAFGAREFVVDGEPIQLRGRIDRIDFHPLRKTWAIWDYKTGEQVAQPVNKHRKAQGEWRDLQLPLYCFLAEELLAGGEVEEIGYIALCKDPGSIGFKTSKNWARPSKPPATCADVIPAAMEAAAEVVRRIRNEEFFTSQGLSDRDPIFAAIGGVGLVSEHNPSGDGDDGEDDDGEDGE